MNEMEVIDLETMQADTEYEDRTVAGVRDNRKYWLIEMDNGVSLGLDKSHGGTPKPGDVLRVYPEASPGVRIRGIALNGTPLYLRSARPVSWRGSISRTRSWYLRRTVQCA